MEHIVGTITSAQRIGKAEAALAIARAGDEALKYETEDEIVKRCIRNEFLRLVNVRQVCHPSAHPDYEKEKRALQLAVMLKLYDKAMLVESWTFGKECAWFAGETDGYHYAAFFKPWCMRIMIEEVAHSCLDCK